MTFIGDYRPTKRVGLEELDGCLKLLIDKLDVTAENGEMSTALYMGALIALETMRNGRFEYPQDFMAVFDNQVKELYGGE